jgi:hypothetical protein
MALMLKTCERFVVRNNLQFSADPNPAKRKNLATSATHLGHEFHESGTINLDTRMKRAELIRISTEIRETFSWC